MESDIFKILLQQSPMILLMGVAIYWLVKQLMKAQDEKDAMSKEVIKHITLWEEKATKLGEVDEQFKKETVSLLKDVLIALKNK